MRVYVKNKDLTMYDRHSAFGPPVDEGESLTKATLIAKTIVVSGSGARKNLGILRRNYDLPSGSSNIPNESSLPGFQLSSSVGGKTVSIKFVTASVNGSTNLTNSTASYTSTGKFNASSIGNLYMRGTSSYVDVTSIKTNFSDQFATRYDADTNTYYDNNRSGALAKMIMYAIELQRYHNNTNIGAVVNLVEVTDTDLYPSNVPSDARYFRHNLEIFQSHLDEDLRLYQLRSLF